MNTIELKKYPTRRLKPSSPSESTGCSGSVTKKGFDSKNDKKFMSRIQNNILSSQEKIMMMKYVHNFSLFMKLFPEDKWKNNETIAREAIKGDGNNVLHFSDMVRNKKDIMLNAIKISPVIISYIPMTLRDDKEFILDLMKLDVRYFECASHNLKGDKPFIIGLITTPLFYIQPNDNWNLIDHIAPNLKIDRDVCFELVRINVDFISHLCDIVRNDDFIILFVVERNGGLLEYASERLKKNQTIVSKAVSNYGPSIQWAHKDLRASKEMAKKAIMENGTSIYYVVDSLRNDKELIKLAVERQGHHMFSCVTDPRLLHDKEFISELMKMDSAIFHYLPWEIKRDMSFLLDHKEHVHVSEYVRENDLEADIFLSIINANYDLIDDQ